MSGVVCDIFCCFKQKTAYEMRISDWSSDVCSSDLADKSNIGTVLYNRALVNAYYYTEAILIAQGEFGNKPLTGEQIQWGMERLDITQEMIDEAGKHGRATWRARVCTYG